MEGGLVGVVGHAEAFLGGRGLSGRPGECSSEIITMILTIQNMILQNIDWIWLI